MLTPALSFAQSLYKWEDANGGTHYSDGSASIPKSAKKIERVQVEHDVQVDREVPGERSATPG